jgi:hypothetical protein
MGNAFVGVVGDTHNIYFNPAGLASCPSPEVSAVYSPQEFDQTAGSFEGVFPFGTRGTVGVGVQYQTVEKIALRSGEFAIPSNTSSSNSRISIAYARGWGPYSVGVALKSLDQTFSGIDDKGHGWSLDMGTVYSWERLKWGMSLQNLAGDFRWSTGRKEPVSLIVKTGVSYLVFPWLLTALDVEGGDGSSLLIHGGVEAQYREAFFRAGMKDEHPTLGIGLGFHPLFKLRLRFDYGLEFDPSGLNDVHQFGLSALF